MRKLYKTKLSGAVALAVTLGCSAIMSQSALAMPDATMNGPLGHAAVAAGDPYVSNNNLGQALLYPYYTTRGGMDSLIEVINTSDKIIVAKVRFREKVNSRDVLDFNLVLSPYDRWSGLVTEGSNGPVFKTWDTSCTVPTIPMPAGQPLNDDSFTNATFADLDTPVAKGSVAAQNRLSEGHVEIIPMGQYALTVAAPAAGSAQAFLEGAVHNTSGTNQGVPASCGNVQALFAPAAGRSRNDFGARLTALPNPLIGAIGPVTSDMTSWDGGVWTDGDPGLETIAAALTAGTTAPGDYTVIPAGMNPLRGSLTFINEDGGTSGAMNAVAIADFMVEGAAAPFGTLTTAMDYPYYMEPSLASRDGLWTMSGLDEVEEAISSATVSNEWSENNQNGGKLDWVINFPTKLFHVDTGVTSSGLNPANLQAANSGWRLATTGVGTYEPVAPFVSLFNSATGESRVAIDTPVFVDEEEQVGGSAPIEFSPGTLGATPALRHETNVITFAEIDGLGQPVSGGVLNSEMPLNLDARGLLGNGAGGSYNTTNGWLTIQPYSAVGTNALPMTGFAMKTRTRATAALSFGQVLNHSWSNPVDAGGNAIATDIQ